VWTDAATSLQVSLFDQGLFTRTGQNLHRITMEYPLYPTSQGLNTDTVSTDLYIDPNTHLLLYSVDLVRFNSSPGQSFSRITSYGGYKSFSGIAVPTALQQTLNGQLQWSLQLRQIAINTNPPADTFSF
jgi:hypothetical protein